MTELERALVGLGAELDLPEAPDVTAAVLRRIAEVPARRRVPGRRALVLAFVVLAVAIGAVMAVPPARTAILEFFGLKGATVQRVETLPDVPTSPTAPRRSIWVPMPLTRSGKPNVKIADVVLPAALGRPDAVVRRRRRTGARLTLVYEPGPGFRAPLHRRRDPRHRVPGDLDPEFVEKFAGAARASSG